MSSHVLDLKDTKKLQSDVRALMTAMSPRFREHLMHSFMWSEDKLEEYLSRETALEGDKLKDAYSHLESLLARIESFGADISKHPFPTYDKWIDEEYQKYKTERSEDREDIERLIGEGGVVSPGKTSPMDTMENDSLSHYNHLKSEFDEVQDRSREAIALMQLPQFISLRNRADEMCKLIMNGIHH
jgi:hypothetical protein